MSTTRQVVSFRIRPELKASILEEADYQDRTFSYIMEQAAIEYLQRRDVLPASIKIKTPRERPITS